MPETLKKTWDDIQHLVPADINHPAINTLVNGRGQRLAIDVFLHHEKEQVLGATVSLLHSPNFLQTAALAVLLRKMEQQGVSQEWDTVSFVTPNTQQFPKSAFHTNDPFTQWIEIGVLTDLGHALEMHQTLSAALKNKSPELYEQQSPANLAAIFIGATATVVSEDLEKLVAKSKSLLPFLLHFEPKGYEF